MKIKLLAFGIAKDIVGGSSSHLDVNDGASISDVKDALSSLYPEFKTLRKYSIAVNESYREDNFKISSGDELVIIPPVSGG